jgi:hypothetical protein
MRNCASENDERWIVSHSIGFMESLVYSVGRSFPRGDGLSFLEYFLMHARI